MPQPLWELRLNPDYGTLPGVPLLEALQGVGVLGAGVPPYSQRAVSMNIYVGGPPTRLSRGVKNIWDISLKWGFLFCRAHLSVAPNGEL